MLHASPAMRAAGRGALSMAGIDDPNTQIDFFDVYSCFPVAVQVGRSVGRLVARAWSVVRSFGRSVSQ